MTGIFHEKQRFTQWWLLLLLALLASIPLYAIYQQLILNTPFGNNPISDIGLILLTIILYIFLSFFFIIYLKTTIDKNGIHMQFFPLINKLTSWDEIKEIKIVNYGFVGGWGIRPWTAYGTVYNIKGQVGLAIELNNGKKFLIGTQRKAEIEAFLRSIGKIQ